MISIIAGVAENGVIGKNNDLPWHLPADMKHFRETTKDGVVIMGRKTFESMDSKPLPKRENIVISRTLDYADGVDVCKSLGEAIAKAKTYSKEIFVIGGAGIYNEAMKVADRLIISHVHGRFEGDTYFPEIGFEWEAVERKKMDGFELVIYTRKDKE